MTSIQIVMSGHSNLTIVAIANFYRPQTKFAKVMFSLVSVCPRGGGVLGFWGRGLCPGGVFVQECLCPGGLYPGGSMSRRISVRRVLCHIDPSYGNERAVRILLECILVFDEKKTAVTHGFCNDDTGYPPPNIGVAPGTAAPVCGADGYKVALLAPNIPAK